MFHDTVLYCMYNCYENSFYYNALFTFENIRTDVKTLF